MRIYRGFRFYMVTSFQTSSLPSSSKVPEDFGYRGLIIGLTVIGTWAVSTGFLFTIDVSQTPFYLIIPAMFWQIFLYTGLFITAHDAMHGVVFPQNKTINDLVGNVAVKIYALFDYQKLVKKHWEHHYHPASAEDPDYHEGTHKNFFIWYAKFMGTHWSWWRILGLSLLYNVIKSQFHIPDDNLTLFWVLPSLLSSVQLFYFGTYLPHREPAAGYSDDHRATSIYRPLWLSFITCYHFGYHWEHHEYPLLPWWQLPKARKTLLAE